MKRRDEGHDYSERLPVHLGQVISGFKAGCRKAHRNLAFAAAEPLPAGKSDMRNEPLAEPLPAEKGDMRNEPLAEPLPAEKGDGGSLYVAAQSLQSSVSLPPLFAKGYNDLILRSFDELPTWRNYLRDNPRRLLLRRVCPQWLRPAFGITIGPYVCSAIGNRELLSAERRVQVRVSRRLVGEALDKELEHFLTLARRGAVLVSPAISPGEKRIMRSAFNEKLPIIVVVENGFTPLSKPHGEQFYACGEGRLLILSPWEHHNEKAKLTAQQCKEMNLLAWEICR